MSSKRGKSGFMVVRCQYVNCSHVNRVSQGYAHHVKKSRQLFKKGMPCFAINTKL
ncbi:hypothetical protein DPMN_031217 [Dreissena polymorpha]|uniref:Uncharacterized protein n=1 Tax=Dreissena polymorpha TaxID=45954 RepID=A0A9D4RJ35_DREPO|nr:hypothetical protein DPMN_031217 [Dreissena polymorpha]